ncbi:hypothetical protein JZ751_010979 [Albula glossodonta]|uniref:Uncharacterized protein n=1 Tax=Albula glossodonta TaxID=121402 RepID=A0A8T2NY65_9TELE|nr:hypothetical protein JZ751_010979 [Albula glossodonta]
MRKQKSTGEAVYLLWLERGCMHLHVMLVVGILACYWVEMSFTIMSMIREPRGQLHRSMLGFRILSSSS